MPDECYGQNKQKNNRITIINYKGSKSAVNELGLKINLSSNNDTIQIHNKKLNNTVRRIIKLQNDFKDLFYNNKEIKTLSVKINLNVGAQILQQKGRPIPIHLQDQVAQELKRSIKHGYVERATEITEDGFLAPQ